MRRPAFRQHGMALIAVLWLVASMGLIIAGVVRSVRSEAQSAGLQRHTSIATAKADAAILLALQYLHAQQKGPPKGLLTLPVKFGEELYQVQVMPLNGLVDLNRAPATLLADLYQYSAAMGTDAALSLAQATLATRQIKNAKSLEQGFDSVSDLMKVPGMAYNVYAKVAPLVTTDIQGGGGRVNPLAAPVALLEVMLAGNAARAAQYAAQRSADHNVSDSTFFKPDQIEMVASNNLRFHVDVALPDGSATRKTWHVYWGTDARSKLPWHLLGVWQAQLPL